MDTDNAPTEVPRKENLRRLGRIMLAAALAVAALKALEILLL